MQKCNLLEYIRKKKHRKHNLPLAEQIVEANMKAISLAKTAIIVIMKMNTPILT